MDLDKCQLAQNKQILHDANKNLVSVFWSEKQKLVHGVYIHATI